MPKPDPKNTPLVKNLTLMPFTSCKSGFRAVTPDKLFVGTWHTHPGDEMILAVDGHVFYREKGKAISKIPAGKNATIKANVEHWQCSARRCDFVHVTLFNKTDQQILTWVVLRDHCE